MRALILILLLTTFPAAADQPAEVRQFFLDGIAAFNRHDLETFLRQFAPELEMWGAYEWFRGGAAVRERFRFTFETYPAVKMEIDDLKARAIAPDVVAVDFRFRTYPKGDGPAFHGVGSGVYVKREGRWVEVLEHETVTKIDAELRR